MEFRCILKEIKPELGSSLLWCLFIGTVVMLALACGGNRQSVDDDLYIGTPIFFRYRLRAFCWAYDMTGISNQ